MYTNTHINYAFFFNKIQVAHDLTVNRLLKLYRLASIHPSVFINMYPIQDHRQSWSLSHTGKRWGTPMTGCQSTTETQRHGYRCECEQSQLYSQNRITYYPNIHVFGLVKKVGALGGNPHMQRENVLTHRNASEPRIFLQ